MDNILIVENDVSNRLCLSEFLVYQGYACQLASQGAEALSLLQEYQVHLIITDLDMPVMNGFQFLEALEQNSYFQKIPVLIISGHITPEAQNLTSRHQVKGLISKPYEFKEISSAISQILRPDIPKKKSCS